MRVKECSISDSTDLTLFLYTLTDCLFVARIQPCLLIDVYFMDGAIRISVRSEP